MKGYYLKFIISGLLVFGLFSCKPSLNQKIKAMANDGEISEIEFNDLLKYASSDPKLQKYTDSKVLYNYIESEFAKSIPPVKVWNPSPNIASKSFNVNVYIENSASIYGYVKENEMKNAVYEMLGNIKTACDTLNLNYINNKVLSQVKNAQLQDNKTFVLNLNPASFKKKGGNRDVTDMAEILANVLSKTNEKNLSVLISDFVFSPGSGVDAEKYLNIQRISIRDNLRDKLKTYKLAVAAYQMNAAFDGDYFDHNNKGEEYKGNRPYYIWLIGDEDEVKTLLAKQIIRNSDNGYLNKAAFVSTKEISPTNYQIVKIEKTGNFSLSAGAEEINRAVAQNGVFGFSIAVDFSNDLRDRTYFSDSTNYVADDKNFTISARELTNEEKNSSDLTGYTHLITLTSKRLINQELHIKVISKLPSWIGASNSINDSNINENKSEQNKTFGLDYLMNGVIDAFNFYPDVEKNVISEFTIKINK